MIYQTRHGNKLLAFPSEQNSTGKNKKKKTTTTSTATTVFNLNMFKKWNLFKQCSSGWLLLIWSSNWKKRILLCVEFLLKLPISQYVVNKIIFLRLMKKSCDFNKIIRGIMTRQLVIIFFLCLMCFSVY